MPSADHEPDALAFSFKVTKGWRQTVRLHPQTCEAKVIKDMPAWQVSQALRAKGTIASSTPYRRSYARFAPSLINTEEEIERALVALASL